MTIHFNGKRAEYAEYVRSEVLRRSDQFPSYAAMARYWGVPQSTLNKVVNGHCVADSLAKRLCQLGIIKDPPPPKDARPRRWMRTDSIEKAKETLEKTYPDYVVVPRDYLQQLESKTRQGY